MVLSGTGITAGTKIVGWNNSSGSYGGAGIYYVDTPQVVASGSYTGTLTVSVGQIFTSPTTISGTGVAQLPNSYVTRIFGSIQPVYSTSTYSMQISFNGNFGQSS